MNFVFNTILRVIVEDICNSFEILCVLYSDIFTKWKIFFAYK